MLFQYSADHGFERTVVADQARLAGRRVLFGGHPRPPEVPGRIAGELAEERPLRPAVALPERVGRVDLPEVVGQPTNELLSVEADEVVLPCEVSKGLVEVRADVRQSPNDTVRAMLSVRTSPAHG